MDMLRAWGKGHDIANADLIKAAAVGGVGARKVREMTEQVVEALGDMSVERESSPSTLLWTAAQVPLSSPAGYAMFSVKERNAA